MSQIHSMGALEWGFLGLLSILWGGSFFFIKVALAGFHPLSIVFFRVCIGSILLLGLLRLTRIPLPRTRTVWGAFLVMGLLNNVIPFSLITWGQQFISAGLASLLNASTPFFTVIVTHLFTKDEKLNLNKMIGIILGFFGVAVLIGLDALRKGTNSLPGELAILGATLSYAFAGTWGRKFKTLGVLPLQTATGQLLCSSVVLIPVFLFIPHPWSIPFPSPYSIGALLSLSFLSTALAYVLYFRILSTSGATNVLLVTFLLPVTAILLGILFLGETFQLRHGFGMALIGAGLVAVDGRLLKRRRERRGE
ncbi:MAG: DMT family transporter [Spirochaetes bacterium]|nr:DMT family transporter [Spirochaetota bacterium]